MEPPKDARGKRAPKPKSAPNPAVGAVGAVASVDAAAAALADLKVSSAAPPATTAAPNKQLEKLLAKADEALRRCKATGPIKLEALKNVSGVFVELLSTPIAGGSDDAAVTRLCELVSAWTSEITHFRETQRALSETNPSEALSPDEITDVGFFNFVQFAHAALRGFLTRRGGRDALSARMRPAFEALDTCWSVEREVSRVRQSNRGAADTRRKPAWGLGASMIPETDAALVAILEPLLPTPEEARKKALALEAIRTAVRGTWPEADAKVFGSSLTGLDFRASDMDVLVDGAAAPTSSFQISAERHVMFDVEYLEKMAALGGDSGTEAGGVRLAARLRGLARAAPAPTPTTTTTADATADAHNNGEEDEADDEEEEEEEDPTLPPLERALANLRSNASQEGKLVLEIAQVLRELPGPVFSDVVTVARARVPVVRCVHAPTGVHLDVVVSNVLGGYNSRMVQTYTRLDARVRPLIMAVKLWAKRRGLSDASLGFISSYAWVLLVLFYLQRVPTQLGGAVVPDLQSPALPGTVQAKVDEFEVRFCDDVDAARAAVRSSSPSTSVTSLLRGFFLFYGSVFDWKTKLVNVHAEVEVVEGGGSAANNGGAVAAKKPSSVPAWRWCIMDPFETTHDLGTKISSRRAQIHLQTELERACDVSLASGGEAAWLEKLFEACPPRDYHGRPCTLCGDTDHRSRKCFLNGIASKKHADVCFKCGQVGHVARACKAGGAAGARGGAMRSAQTRAAAAAAPPPFGACFECGEMGHRAAQCPRLATTAATVASVTCFECGEVGHVAAQCPFKRGGGGSGRGGHPPSSRGGRVPSRGRGGHAAAAAAVATSQPPPNPPVSGTPQAQQPPPLSAPTSNRGGRGGGRGRGRGGGHRRGSGAGVIQGAPRAPGAPPPAPTS